MATIIVDSGSSKADWRVVNEKDVLSITTRGFNPVFHSNEVIYEEVQKTFSSKIEPHVVKQIHFYGAGCWDDKRKDVVRRALARFFAEAKIAIEHDLLGAARAACMREAGITCILGTGSNSCLYDGTAVTDNITNLGYLLGDEGSGTFLGKALLRAYFYREMPSELLQQFEAFVPGGKSSILDKVYGKETPNVYLASFVPFLSTYREHPFVLKMLYDAFALFIDRHVRKYQNHNTLPIHFIGSVAYHFQNILKIVLEERNMRAGSFIQKPIDHLVAFHASSSLVH